MLLVYLLVVERGFKTAMLARDSFSKLLATGPDRGLRAAGLRHRRRRHELIPLTGVTLPFISYGGSSILANFMLLALLLLVSDRPRRRKARRRHERADRRLFVRRRRAVRGARRVDVALERVFDAQALPRQTALNAPQLLAGAEIRRGMIRAGDGSAARPLGPQADGGTYTRRYPTEAAASRTRSATTTRVRARAGLERFRNDALRGRRATSWRSIVEPLSGTAQGRRRPRHDARPAPPSRSRSQQLDGPQGSVVAIDPQTGEVRVMVSNPGYDPNDRAARCTAERPATRLRRCSTARRRPATRRARRSRS